ALTATGWGGGVRGGQATEPASPPAAVAGADAVVHLVAIIKGSRTDFERIMAQGTRDLVAAAQEAGVGRFILASALGLDEGSKDRVPYFAAEGEMERAVKAWGLAHGIFRLTCVISRARLVPTA